jgi:hypothetical protein
MALQDKAAVRDQARLLSGGYVCGLKLGDHVQWLAAVADRAVDALAEPMPQLRIAPACHSAPAA